MNITVNINAPELAQAIEALAGALNANNVVAFPETKQEEKETPKVVKNTEPKVEVKKDEPKQEETKAEADEKQGISLEVVRGKLAELSQNGKQKQVKALITSFGVKKLTDIPAENYPELLEKAEEL